MKRKARVLPSSEMATRRPFGKRKQQRPSQKPVLMAPSEAREASEASQVSWLSW